VKPGGFSRELGKATEDWHNHDLSIIKFKYLLCDGFYFEMQIDRTIEKVSVRVLSV